MKRMLLVFIMFAQLAAGKNPSMNYEGVKTLIQTKQIKSVEEAISAIAQAEKVPQYASDPNKNQDKRDSLDIFANPILIEKSESIQSASAESPRTILFNTDASFIMTFTGKYHSGTKASDNALEIIQYNFSTHTFDFSRILFPEDGKAAVQFQDGLSSPRPSSCIACHQGAPIWQPYPFWPGVMATYETPTYRERTVFKNFLAHGANDARYRVILPLFESVGLDGVAGSNDTFTTLLAKLNADRIAQQLEQSPSFENLRAALMGAVINCKNIEQFFPSTWVSQRRAFSEVFADTKQRMQKHDQYKNNLAIEGKDPMNLKKSDIDSVYWASTNSKVRYVTEEMMGVDMGNWSLGRPRRSYVFNDGRGLGLWKTLEKYSDGILPEVYRKDPYSQFVKSKYENGYRVEYLAEPDELLCQNLKKTSLRSLEGSTLAIRPDLLHRVSTPSLTTH